MTTAARLFTVSAASSGAVNTPPGLPISLPDRRKHLPDVPQQRLEVFALLAREVNKLRVEPAAFEQAEAPKQLFRLHRAAVAAYHRQITGYAVAPKLALRRGI